MATVNFRLKGDNNPSPIYVRFKNGSGKKEDPESFDYWRKSGKVINPKDWDKSTHMPLKTGPRKTVQLVNLHGKLEKLASHIIDEFNQSNLLKIDGSWLQKQIDIFNDVYIEEKGQSHFLVDAIQHVIDTASIRENSQGGLGLSKSRVNSYKTLLNLIKEYQGKKKFKVEDVNIKFGSSFLDWMLNKRNYAESYSKKKIDDLKTVCSEAEIEGIPVSKQLRKVKGGKTKAKFIIYLNPKELRQIEKTDLDSSSLRNARKWLLLGCNIGQRGGDLLQLSDKNFVIRNNLELIELTQQKTGKQVTIPVLPKTKEILNEGLPYPISLQKFNDLIKEICKEAGFTQEIPGSKVTMVDEKGNEIPKDEKGRYIEKGEKRKIFGEFPKWQLITSHVCRRSFASNQYGILPTPLIMQITAHGTEKMFLNYIGKSSMDYAQQIADFYAKEEKKAKKESSLNIVKDASNQ